MHIGTTHRGLEVWPWSDMKPESARYLPLLMDLEPNRDKDAANRDDDADERDTAADENDRRHDVLDSLSDGLDRQDMRAQLTERLRQRKRP